MHCLTNEKTLLIMHKIIAKWIGTKANLILYLCLFSSGLLMSQNVSGTLTDTDGTPLIGVNVLVQGTTTGTISDIDGSYSIPAKAGDVLVFSYVGFSDMEVVVGNDPMVSMSLVMETDSETLDEIIVIGYGTRI
jgi:hypothetical protein